MSEIDLSDTIKAKSDQLNASEIAGEKTIKITDAKKVSSDQPVVINYEGDDGKPWKPCLSMRRVLAHLWGEKVDMTGRMVTLVCDPTVTWAGEEVGGIRIKAMSHIDGAKTVPLRASKHKVKKYKIDPIAVTEAKPKVDAAKLHKAAEAKAVEGIEAYKQYYMSLSNDERAAIQDKHEDYKQLAETTEKADEEEQPVRF